MRKSAENSINQADENADVINFLEMYLHDDNISWEEFLENIFRFYHLLTSGLIKGVSPI